MNLMLATNSVLLILFTILLSFSTVKSFKKIKMLFFRDQDECYSKIRRAREAGRYYCTISKKISFIDMVELHLIGRSNIRRYLPFINFYTLAGICMAVFLLLFSTIYSILLFIPSSVVVCLLFSLLPAFVLDLMGRYNSEKVRRRLAEFISVLNRWCAVKEDIFFAFEKAVNSGIDEPLKTFVRDMVIQVNRGIEPTEALDILQMKVDNSQFKDFVVNIKQAIRHRGDIIKLLTNLESQFYKIEEEYNRRKISTYRDRLVLYFVMFAVIFIAFYFIKLNPKVEHFYMETVQGKSLLMGFSILYAAGFYLTFRITDFRY